MPDGSSWRRASTSSRRSRRSSRTTAATASPSERTSKQPAESGRKGQTLTSLGGEALASWRPILWSRSAPMFRERLCAVVVSNLTRSEWRGFLRYRLQQDLPALACGQPLRSRATTTASARLARSRSRRLRRLRGDEDNADDGDARALADRVRGQERGGEGTGDGVRPRHGDVLGVGDVRRGR